MVKKRKTLDNRVIDTRGKVIAKADKLDDAKSVWRNAPFGTRLQTRVKGKWKDYDEGR